LSSGSSVADGGVALRRRVYQEKADGGIVSLRRAGHEAAVGVALRRLVEFARSTGRGGSPEPVRSPCSSSSTPRATSSLCLVIGNWLAKRLVTGAKPGSESLLRPTRTTTRESARLRQDGGGPGRRFASGEEIPEDVNCEPGHPRKNPSARRSVQKSLYLLPMLLSIDHIGMHFRSLTSCRCQNKQLPGILTEEESGR
jgi:hypothetical protein